MANNIKSPADDQTFVSHLIELRDRMLRILIAVLVVFLCLFPFANDLYTMLAEPLLRNLPETSTMIATQVASPFLTPFKLTLVLAFFIAIPVVLYQIWSFIAPGLYHDERKLVLPLVVSSALLFYMGMAFAYYVVFPLVFGFLIGIAPEGVAVMTDISSYLDFVLKMFFAFGVAFEVPIATILLVWSGATTPKKLASNRAYVVVGAFIIGMLLTPPDIISQTLLAIPMLILFELGIIFSKYFIPKDSDHDSDDDVDDNDNVEDDDIDDDDEPDRPVEEPADEPVKAKHSPRGPSTGDSNHSTIEDDVDKNDYDEDEHLKESDHEPMSEEDMDAELDRIEQEEEDAAKLKDNDDKDKSS